ncbi:hypothetical protein LYNGBM3L_50610 [Moorena producens 3L]|uniref:Uncharacterized protein n=1 Tax=Moorena producens 3L TaxID=489825 RepID=F4XY01_9CYAN|nr:hypothetical protein [Moorena producens]EGJ30507.1 hypothetical protein LYNGBM3L_50610 [Moorena producens 3L]OLT68602.1 hypothetical protein BI334_29570 [Moorena producens 3L]
MRIENWESGIGRWESGIGNRLWWENAIADGCGGKMRSQMAVVGKCDRRWLWWENAIADGCGRKMRSQMAVVGKCDRHRRRRILEVAGSRGWKSCSPLAFGEG